MSADGDDADDDEGCMVVGCDADGVVVLVVSVVVIDCPSPLGRCSFEWTRTFFPLRGVLLVLRCSKGPRYPPSPVRAHTSKKKIGAALSFCYFLRRFGAPPCAKTTN